jgi:hypothetical protein
MIAKFQTFKKHGLLLFLVLTLTVGPVSAQQKIKKKDALRNGKAVLWQEPTDISSRDLFLGPGGADSQPDLSHVVFVQDDSDKGHSTKYRVRDGAGREWVAKLGSEAQPETAASRLVWAVGYASDITYFVPHLSIEGKGSYDNVRLELRPKDTNRLDNWKWDENPFVGTSELQGLKVLMALLDNWDLKDVNNRIVAERNDQGEIALNYVVSDLGATFGKTGGVISRSRNKPSDYAKAKFIRKVKNNLVEFDYHGKRGELLRNVTVEQAK